jgi:GNAT superfamily N-acetyltransferase/surface polysaccharide O-acyltransferase-like enzyme
MSTLRLRAGRGDEAQLLSDLALRSKGHWGDQAFLDACRAELTLTPEEVHSQRVTVAERDGQIVGFYALAGDPPEGTLADLFVASDHIGTGVGRMLWRHAVLVADRLGFERLTLEPDPGAERFYLAMGAHRVGSVPSGSIPGRFLPLLEFHLAGRAVLDRPPDRRHELDLLRALVVVGLVFFHTAVIFGAGEFPVKAAAENRVVTVLLGFGAIWGMPLLFLISGMGIWYSLRSRTAAAFARERLRRLGVPLLVGLLTLVPLQVYLGLRRAGDASAYTDFYKRFWDVRPSPAFPFVVTAAPDEGLFETGHLWFLVCLLGFSLVLLPAFGFLRAPRGVRLVERMAGLLARQGRVFLLALPLAAVEILLGSEVGQGGWNRGSYALLLVYGFLAAADPRLGEAFQRHWRPAAAVGLLVFLATGVAYAAADAHAEPFTDTDPLSTGFRLLKSIDGWLWVVAVVGLARSHIQHRRRSALPSARPGPDRASLMRRLGAYANDAVLPFYVLHETVIVVVAYLVLTWPIGGGAQYCLIAPVSLAATLLLYDLGIRRNRVTRFLFGLKQPRGPVECCMRARVIS